MRGRARIVAENSIPASSKSVFGGHQGMLEYSCFGPRPQVLPNMVEVRSINHIFLRYGSAPFRFADASSFSHAVSLVVSVGKALEKEVYDPPLEKSPDLGGLRNFRPMAESSPYMIWGERISGESQKSRHEMCIKP
jgi:hypothetical protein